MEFPLLTPELEEEFERRLSRVRMAMLENETEALLIGSTVNILYMTGGIYRGYIYIPQTGAPLFFMIPPAEATGDNEVNIRKPEQIPELLAERGLDRACRIGLEYDDLYYSEVERLKKLFPGAGFSNGSIIMRQARLVKTEYELNKMEEDGVRQSAVYSRISKVYREGMSDVELQSEIERLLRQEGCLGYLRTAGSRMEINMGSLLAGPNADEPSPYDFSMGGAGVDPSLPVGASGVILKPGMAVMVDMNGGFNGYQTDMTRCWTIGEPSDKAQKAYDCSMAILHELESLGRPGVEVGELYRRAVAIADEWKLSDYFMGHRHKVSFIGHGVGIELNEGPVVMGRNKSLLEENMTIALEPKFVLPEIGALGCENTYVVKSDGLKNLTTYNETLKQL
ncbi:MAG: Xaa-Pro peptidase family protein [Muribaculaceae bacterium]|nr:Xaa-Pro peptidase family protein [Muribaculaceae bacterium]